MRYSEIERRAAYRTLRRGVESGDARIAAAAQMVLNDNKLFDEFMALRRERLAKRETRAEEPAAEVKPWLQRWPRLWNRDTATA